MIEIKVDKESEMLWLREIIGSGVLNTSIPYTLKFLGVPLKQNINYKASDNYEDDIKEKREEFNKRFAESGLVGWQIEKMLKKELLGKNENDSI